MPLPYYQLLGHCLVAKYAVKESTELTQALSKAGFGKDDAGRAATYVKKGEELIDAKLHACGEDRSHEHQIHVHTSELEMWMQTVRFLVEKAVADPAEVADIFGDHIHGEEHALSAVAQALRTISMIRVERDLAAKLGNHRKVRDVLTRGQSLLKKLYVAGDIRLAPEANNAGDPVFTELEAHRVAMTSWLVALDTATAGIPAKDSHVLGRLGYLPDGVGIPVGGTSYAVVLHERGQAERPDPHEVRPCTGWSIGRQGRNKENLGKGFVTPEFE